MTSENVSNAGNAKIRNEKANILINWSRLKTSWVHQMLQMTTKKQSFWSSVDQLMTCDNVPIVENPRTRIEISIILIKW